MLHIQAFRFITFTYGNHKFFNEFIRSSKIGVETLISKAKKRNLEHVMNKVKH